MTTTSRIPTAGARSIERWRRLETGVRCAYNPAQPQAIRCWLLLGDLLVRKGWTDAAAVHQRMLSVLLATANDEALPWFWRSVCLEHVNLPQARLTSLLAPAQPLAVQAIAAAVSSARERLPLFALTPAADHASRGEL